MKRYFLYGIIAFFSLGLNAQVTQNISHSQKLYEQAKEYYDNGLYLECKATLKDYFYQNKNEILEREKQTEAELMYAISSVKAGTDDGERLLLSFIQNHQPEKIAQDALIQLGDYYFNQNQYQQALEYFEKVDATTLGTEDEGAFRFKKGYCHYMQDDDEAAAIEWNTGRNIDHLYYYETNYYYGILAFKKGKYEEALHAFEKANAKNDYATVIPYYQSMIYFEQADYEQVIAITDKVFEGGKKTVKYENINELHHLRGKAFFELEDYESALPHLVTFEQEAKELRAQDLYQVAYTRYQNGKYRAAIQNFEELKNEDSPLGQNVLYNLANSYLEQNNRLSARNAFQGAAKMDYNLQIKEISNFQYGKLSYELGFDRAAIEAFQNVAPASKYYGESQQLLSKVFLNTRDYDKALELMDAISYKTPDIQQAYQKVAYYKGISLFNDGKTEESKKYFRMSIVNAPDQNTKAMALFRLGEIAHKEKRYTDSYSEFKQYQAVVSPSISEDAAPYLANYIQGYNALKLKDYANASTYFVNSLNGILDQWESIGKGEIRERIFPDALLRAGDSYFKQNDYENALAYYQTSIKYGYLGSDYAFYQQARIQGLLGDYNAQVASFQKLNQLYPNSNYADDALYNLGDTYFRLGNPVLAEETLMTLIQKNNNSNLISKTYLLLGLINFNNNQKAKAQQYYEAVFKASPSEDDYSSALKALEEIYLDNNNPEGFIDFKKNELGIQINEEDKEILLFQSAENQYESGNIEGAIIGYGKYISKYPNGRFVSQAHYYRGESHVIQKEYEKAFPDYEQVVAGGNSPYYLNALYKAATIAFNIDQYQKANLYYKTLIGLTNDENQKLEANMGLLISSYALDDAEGTYSAADYVVNNTTATEAQKLKAHFLKAKMALVKEDKNTALTHFAFSSNQNNEEGAESKYHVAYLLYEMGDYASAKEKVMYHLKSSKTYTAWVVNGLFLLSDIALAQEDLFSARAAIETILENYSDVQTQQMAEDKLAIIKTKEAESSRIVPEE